MADAKQPRGTGVGMGFLGWLALLLIALKLTGYIGWSWWWVLAPLWVPVAVVMLGAAAIGITALLVAWGSK